MIAVRTGDVREAARLEDLLRSLRREQALSGATSRGNLVRRWAFSVALPWLWRWVLLPAVGAAIVASSNFGSFWVLVLVALFGARAGRALELTPFLALHAADRRAVLAARWRAFVPELLWTGVAWAAAVVLKKGEPPPAQVLPALGAVLFLPTFASAARIRWKSLRHAPGLPTTVAFAVAVGAVGVAMVGSERPKTRTLGAGLAVLAGLLVAASLAVPSMRSELGRQWRRRAETRFVARVAGNVAVAAVTFVIAVVAVGFLGRHDVLDKAWESSKVAGVGAVAVVAEIALIALFVRNALRDFVHREVPHIESAPEPPPAGPAPVAAPLPGAGLARLRWTEWRESVPRTWWAFPVFAVWTLRGPLLGVAAVAFPADGSASNLWVAVAAVVLAPRIVAVKETPRLHLFGVDWRRMALHNLRALLLVAAFPTLAAAGAAFAVLGPTAPRGATLAVLASGFLMRAAASGISRAFWRLGCAAEIALSAGWAGALVWRVGIEGSPGAADPATALWFAAGLAAPALAGLPWASWLRSEARLRDDARS